MKVYKAFLITFSLFFLITNSLTFSVISVDNNVTITTDEEIKIIHLTDPHVGGEGANERFKNVLQHVNGLDPDIIIISGDLVDWACLGVPTPPFFRFGIPLRTGERNYEDFNKLIEENVDEDIQILICPGNHDSYVGEKTFGGLRWQWFNRKFDHFERRPFRIIFRYDLIWSLDNYHKYISSNERYGLRSDNYRTTYEDVLFVSLDSGPISINPLYKEDIKYILSHWQQIVKDQWDGWADEYISGEGLNDTQINLLETWLSQSQETNKIVFMHFPAIDIYQTITNNRENFTNLCEENDVNLVLTGHMHTSHIYDSVNGTTIDFEYRPESEDGLLCKGNTYYVTTDDCGGYSTGYRVITIKDGNVTVYRSERVYDQ